MAFAKDYVIKHGPLIMEMDTYRYHGHSMSDPGSTYMTRDEVSGIRSQRDPIERVRKLIQTMELATTAELKAIEKAARKEVVATPRRKTWYEWATGASSEADEAPVSLSALGGEIILSDEQVLMLTHTLTRTLTLRSYSRASRCSCS